MNLRFEPATAERWQDLESLFGSRGACGGCWCMAWRKKRADFVRDKGDANRASLKSLVDADAQPGILAYDGNVPVAWCARRASSGVQLSATHTCTATYR